jgi:hypothetical protein
MSGPLLAVVTFGTVPACLFWFTTPAQRAMSARISGMTGWLFAAGVFGRNFPRLSWIVLRYRVMSHAILL